MGALLQKDRPFWYFDGRDNPWSDNIIHKNDWVRYGDIQNAIIESAYTKNQDRVELSGYIIDFKQMIQINKSDHNKQRRVCRVSDNGKKMIPNSDVTKSHVPDFFGRPNDGADRFFAPTQLVPKSLGEWNISQCPLVDEWVQLYPHYRTRMNETVEQIATGIEKEGTLKGPEATEVAQYMANELRAVKNKSYDEIMHLCVTLYTCQTFLYYLINEVLRANDKTKVNTLGPFCCMLRNFLHEDQDCTHAIVYRGANLKPNEIEEYKNAEGKIRSWTAFSSTTKRREVAQEFGSTLFMIELKNDAAPCYPGRDIALKSLYPGEEEVLLYPGVDFLIEKVEETGKDKPKYIIHLALV